MKDLNLEFDFSQDRERFPELGHLKKGDTVRLEQLLVWFGDRPEEEAEEAALELARRGVELDAAGYRKPGTSGAAAQRLALEEELTAQGRLEELGPEDPLAMTLSEYEELPQLSEARAEELWEELRRGQDQWAETLTTGCLHLVRDIAKTMTGKGVLLLDLMQEGSLGLWQTVTEARAERFYPEVRRQVTQAMARQILRQALADHAGEDLARQMEAYRKAAVGLMKKLGRTPSNEEIAAELHLTPEQTSALEQLTRDALKNPKKKAEEPKESDPEEEAPVEDSAYFALRTRVEDLLDRLEETDRRILTLRFGLDGKAPRSDGEILMQTGLTEEELHRREARALAALRTRETGEDSGD